VRLAKEGTLAVPPFEKMRGEGLNERNRQVPSFEKD
jgi:hypothetical protein